MKKYLFLLLILILGLLQVTILDHFRLFNVRPDLLLLCVVIAALSFDLRSALIFGIFAGLLKDCFSANTFGLNTLLFCLWSILLSRIARLVILDDELFQAATVFILVIIHNLVFGLIILSQGSFVSLGIFLRIVALETILTTIFFPLVIRISKPIYT